ncbi:kinesin-like protein KIF18B isoform X2 [Sphaerodactylus townsendi]|uniref:Uncharacterized protein n=1 Tax=Sphaerodactylus townsendi TaxID=933632 RepID=A0ACB8EUC0_9SAUR|nr:kinesin-like protein KIF18B isoform X2 [Sphaerodactylus townsendi]
MVSEQSTEQGHVSVVVRVRPQTSWEQESNRPRVVQVVSDCLLVFDPEEPRPPAITAGFQGLDSAPRRKGKDLTFAFDRVFGESAAQVEVFENTTEGLLDAVLNGYNCSVFAYGATGAGKTYTMLGSEKDPGIMYLTMAELFRKIEARREQQRYEVLVSYQEVYNEQIHDLLEPKGPLAVREDPEKGVVVSGLSFHQPRTAEQLLKMLARGNQNRTQHPTDINAASSRSHAIFQIYVKRHDAIAQDLQVGKMSLVDLAGSERASVANTRGERLREGANINRSLLALINVINALADAKSKKPHIPYRDSKLTRILKDSIGGNCRTIMIAAVSPSVVSYEDTYNTLKYANRAKEIKLLMKRNTLTLDYHISQYAAICEQLKAEVADLRGRLQAYEGKGPLGNPHGLTHSGPEEAELVRVKEAGFGHPGDRETEAQPELLKPGCPSSSLGGSSLKQDSGRKPGCSITESSGPVLPQGNMPVGQQRMARAQLERLVATVLSVARKQYSVLKAASLLTPDMIMEFEELDHLVPRQSGEPPRAPAADQQLEEPHTVPKVALPLEGPRFANDAERASAAGSSGSPPTLPAPSDFKTPHLPTKRRKRTSGGTTPSGRHRPKRQRKASPPPQQVSSPEGWAVLVGADCTSTPLVERMKSSPTGLPALPPCPPTVTEGRVPLGPSATQNCSTPLPQRGLNTTFELSKNPCAKSGPEFIGWENLQQLPNPLGGPLLPRASMPVFTMKGSSIPRSSSLASRPSMKRRRQVTGSHSLGVPRSRIARLQGNSAKAAQTTDTAGGPSCGTAWRWR